ncbi:histidinol-phosphate transaminase [Sporomusa sphaeroides]|uniref:histidinol-phosphate transaminase n=1 Tax=Sporomusa sphaeroides TaxID=47679 RepID=UPI00315988EE
MFVNKKVKNLEPYIPGYQPNLDDENLIKLNANENPFPPSPKVINAIKNLDFNKLKFYPQSRSDILRKVISTIYNVQEDEVFCGNGSDEIISLIYKVFLAVGNKIVIPYPTYTLYKTVADINGIECIFSNVNEDFTININSLLSNSMDADALIIVNPNAPTGIILSKQQIIEILNNFNGLVIIDEAYIDFSETDESMIHFINQYRNLIVLRTFSKSYSLCGARVGYCFSNNETIGYLDKCKDSYNLNFLSQQVAIAAIKDQEYQKNNVRKIIENRKYLTNELITIGFKVIPSQTNFLLCTPSFDKTAYGIYQKLITFNIFVRYFNSYMLDDKLRITIGTKKEIDELLSALKTIVHE